MDDLQIEILEDGTLKVTTEGVSIPNHRNADKLLELVGQLMGGDVYVKSTGKTAHQHVHRTASMGRGQ